MTTELPGAQQEEFSLRVAFYRRGAVVIETRGVARRKTAGLLARVIRALARPGGLLVVDLSEHLDADYWLVSAVAKAHAAAHASSDGNLRRLALELFQIYHRRAASGMSSQ